MPKNNKKSPPAYIMAQKLPDIQAAINIFASY
jgi:hypothetical protein